MSDEPIEPPPYSSEKVRYWRARLRERLSNATPRDFSQLIWTLDRLRSGVLEKVPSRFENAFENAKSEIGSETFIGAWELEALLIEYGTVALGDTTRRSLNIGAWRNTSALINWLRAIENEQTKRRGPKKIFEELTRIGYRQFPHQSTFPDLLVAVRWWSIIARGPLRDHVEKLYGIDFQRLLRTFLVLFQYFDSDVFRLPPNAVDKLITTEVAAAKALGRLSAPLAPAEPADFDLYEEIAYRESRVRRWPIIRYDHGGPQRSYCAPLRNLFWWRLTSGLYYDLVDVPQFQNEIGLGFEEYIRDMIAGISGWRIEQKANYRLQGFGPTQTPDCVALNAGGQVTAIIECKAVKATLSAQIKLASEANIDRAIDDLAKGVIQITKYHAYLQKIGRPISDACVYMLATLDDWLFFGDVLRQRVMDRAATFAHRSGLNDSLFKSGRVLLCSSSSLEHVLGHYGADVLLEASRSASGEMAGYEFRSVPKSMGKEGMPRSKYFVDRFDQIVGAGELGIGPTATQTASSLT